MQPGDLVRIAGGGEGVVRGLTIFKSLSGMKVCGEMNSFSIALFLGMEINDGLNYAKILCDDNVGYVPDRFLEVVE